MNATTPGWQLERQGRADRPALALGGLVIATLLALPWLGDDAVLDLAVEFLCYLTLAQLWNLLAGYTGLVSIGQQAWVGLGGYALFVATSMAGLPALVAVPLAGLATAALAVPAALLLFRLRPAYFPIGAWVLAEVFRLSFAQLSSLGGGSGMSLPIEVATGISEDAVTRSMVIYYAAFAVAAGAVATLYLLLRSRAGLALTAIRDSEPAAEAVGIDIRAVKLRTYVVAAAGAGMVGALIFLARLRISPDAAFSVTDWTAFVIFIVVIGGVGTLEGPIVGTLLFFILRGLLADFGTIYLLVLGAAAVGVMLLAPAGLWGLVAQRFDLHLFPVRRRLVRRGSIS